MNIERIREVLSKINSTDTDAGHREYTWYEGFDSGVAEALKAMEAEAATEKFIFDKDNCNILGGK